jgi:hypothetical protein
MPQCIDTFKLPNTAYFHPKYMIKAKDTYEICASNVFMVDKRIRFYSTKEEIDNTTKSFHLKVFLATVYDIYNIKDVLKWVQNIDGLDEDTIIRVLDLVWDSLLSEDSFQDPEEFDTLLNVYKKIFPKESDHKLSVTIQKLGKEYLGANLSYHSKKSYHKIIKKHLGEK